MRIPLAAWLPDVEWLENKGQSVAQNVYPTGSGYAPFSDLAVVSTTGLDDQALGAIAAQASDGSIVSFAGDVSKLYKLDASAYSDVSKSGGYSVGDEEKWEFAQFGHRLIAVTPDNAVQYFDIGSSTAFDDLAGSPPTAAHVAIVRDFVVLANTENSPKEVFWSGFDNSEQWTAGVNQSDSQQIQDGGIIQRITGGEIGLIFQERAIVRMTYVGPPVYFQFDVIEENRGVDIPGTVLKVGPRVYFHAQDGFCVTDGSTSQNFGNQQVDTWWATHIQKGTNWLVSSGHDPSRKLLLWGFVSTDATDTTIPDTLLIFNYQTEQWGLVKKQHELLTTAFAQGYTLESLGAAYPIIEDVPASFDSPQWAGNGAANIAGFNTDHQLASFTGDTLAAVVQTSDFEGVQGRRAIVTNSRLIGDPSEAMLACLSRERLTDMLVSTDQTVMQDNGDCPLLSSGRYFQMQISIPAGADWTFINGVDADVQDDGEV